jgi:hypothetical protein
MKRDLLWAPGETCLPASFSRFPSKTIEVNEVFLSIMRSYIGGVNLAICMVEQTAGLGRPAHDPDRIADHQPGFAYRFTVAVPYAARDAATNGKKCGVASVPMSLWQITSSLLQAMNGRLLRCASVRKRAPSL